MLAYHMHPWSCWYTEIHEGHITTNYCAVTYMWLEESGAI